MRIAGLDRLNEEFLTARNGFPVTSISRSYGGLPFDQSPAMVFEEGGRRAYVPVRKAERTPECEGNCSNLFEMAESVRRIVLHDEIPAEQRFDLDPTDAKALATALQKAEGFFPAAVTRVLGAGGKILVQARRRRRTGLPRRGLHRVAYGPALPAGRQRPPQLGGVRGPDPAGARGAGASVPLIHVEGYSRRQTHGEGAC